MRLSRSTALDDSCRWQEHRFDGVGEERWGVFRTMCVLGEAQLTLLTLHKGSNATVFRSGVHQDCGYSRVWGFIRANPFRTLTCSGRFRRAAHPFHQAGHGRDVVPAVLHLLRPDLHLRAARVGVWVVHMVKREPACENAAGTWQCKKRASQEAR